MVVLDTEQSKTAEQLAENCGLKLVAEVPQDYYFTFEEGALLVRDGRQGPHFVLNVDPEKEIEKIQSQKISYKKDLLCKAVGYKKQENWTVFDGTFGLGKDAFHLHSYGCQIIGSEVSPIVFQFMNSKLHEFGFDQRDVQLLLGNSEFVLPQLSAEVDCLYLDPMFENIKKKSAPKKALAFLREVTDVQENVQGVISKAEELGIKRIVVKRPINSEHLYRKPNLMFKGNLIRFDVYTG